MKTCVSLKKGWDRGNNLKIEDENFTRHPISSCSWWGTLRFSWSVPDLRCSTNGGVVALTGWGSRWPAPCRICHCVARSDYWAPILTGSSPPGWWVPPNWVAGRTSPFSSAQAKRKIQQIITLRELNWIRLLCNKNAGKNIRACTWGIFWSRPCQIRGMWLHAHRKSNADDGFSLKTEHSLSEWERLAR